MFDEGEYINEKFEGREVIGLVEEICWVERKKGNFMYDSRELLIIIVRRVCK